MSTLGAFVASPLGAFNASPLGARGPGEPAPELPYRYLVSVNNTIYYYNPPGDNWLPIGTVGGTVRALHWAQGELWSGSLQSGIVSAVARHNDVRVTRLEFFQAEACTDIVSEGPDILIHAKSSITSEVLPGIYNLSTDSFDADSGGFNTISAGTLALGGFAASPTTLYAFNGPYDATLVNSRVALTDWPVELPVNIIDPPPATLPEYPSDPSRQAAYNGASIIVAGFGEVDTSPNPVSTSYGATLFEYNPVANTLNAIDGQLSLGTIQHRWQTSQNHSAIEHDGAGIVVAAGAEWNGASRSEGLLETTGAAVSKPLTCTTGEILSLSREATGRVFMGGDFTDIDENPAGPGVPMDRIAFYNTATKLPEPWLNAAPPAGPINHVLVIPEAPPPTIDPIADQDLTFGTPYSFQPTGTGVLRWRMTDPEAFLSDINIDPNTGLITWDPVPKPTNDFAHNMKVYGGADWFTTETWRLIVNEAIVMPTLGSDTGSSDFYISPLFTLVEGAGDIQYSISATDLPSGNANISVSGATRTSFQLITASTPVGTFFFTIRAENALGFDEATLTVTYT